MQQRSWLMTSNYKGWQAGFMEIRDKTHTDFRRTRTLSAV